MDRQFSPDSIWQYIFGNNQNQNQHHPPQGSGMHGPPYGPSHGGGMYGPPYGPPHGGGMYGPPFGPPNGGGTQGPPSGPPFGGGTQGPPSGGGAAPTSPPPSFVPKKTSNTGNVGVFAVDPGALRPCTYQYVYLWLRGGNSFWAWLTYVGRQSAAGYRWNGYRWVYFGIDLDHIESFTCY